MWNPLAGMTKVAIAGTIAGGVLISGIAWQGDTAVQTTKEAITTLQSRIMEAAADNEFLRSQFDSLNQMYTSDLATANQRIKDLKGTRLELQTQLAELTNQINQDNTTDAEAKAELQAEVNRLEGELDKANQQISELEQFAVATVTDSKSQYTQIDQEAYTAKQGTVEATRDWNILGDLTTAVNYSENNIAIMTKEANLQRMEAYYKGLTRSSNITFVGITTYTTGGKTYLAWLVEPDNSNLDGFFQPVNDIIRSFDPAGGTVQATDVMYYVNTSGQLV